MIYEFGHPFNYRDKPVSKYIAYFAELAEHLPKGKHVTDLFGGIGTIATTLWPILEPASWTSIELDCDCVAMYQGPGPAVVKQGNAFDVTEFGEIVVIDPHRGTLNAMVKSSEWCKLLSAIKASKAQYILMQEYGAYWCHLPNQKKLYTMAFGVDVDKGNYRQVFADYMRTTYGFDLMRSTMGLGSSYYLMRVK